MNNGSSTSARRHDARADSATLDWRTRASIAVAAFVIRLLSSTWRVTSIGRGDFEAESARGRTVLFSFWHGQMLSLIAEHKRPSAVLISDHRDGEIIAQIIRKFGLSVIRGSTSRGATRALLQSSRALHEGIDVGITPDGPRGPRHSYASGALIIAQRSGAPIIPIATCASRAWVLKTWDCFEIPKPFARVIVLYGAPIAVSASDARSAVTETARFATAMNVVAERAKLALQGEDTL